MAKKTDEETLLESLKELRIAIENLKESSIKTVREVGEDWKKKKLLYGKAQEIGEKEVNQYVQKNKVSQAEVALFSTTDEILQNMFSSKANISQILAINKAQQGKVMTEEQAEQIKARKAPKYMNSIEKEEMDKEIREIGEVLENISEENKKAVEAEQKEALKTQLREEIIQEIANSTKELTPKA